MRTRKLFFNSLNSLLLVCLPVVVTALPEDADQPIDVRYDNSELLLDEGIQILYGTSETPAQVTQGTLKISGQEITIERTDGVVKKVTVLGSPARFQQQPALDQEIVIAEGNTILLDNDAQHLSVDGQAKFSQGSDRWSSCHIDYFIESKRLTTPKCPDGVQAEATFSPRTSPATTPGNNQ